MEKKVDCPYCEQENKVRDSGVEQIDCDRCFNTFRVRIEHVNDLVIIETEFL